MPFQALSSVILSGTTTNSIEIQFGQGATGGVLSVVPYSTCNTAVDYLFADTMTLNLTAAPLPDVSVLSNSMAFNCVLDSFYLVGQSSTPNVTWEWSYNSFSVGTNDSIYLHANDGVIDQSYHYVSVFEPINGCKSTDSVLIYYDLDPPSVSQNDIISTPAVFDCTTSSLSLNVVLSNTTVDWDLQPNVLLPSMNTFEIFNADDSTNVYAYVTSTINGCRAQQQYVVAVDDTTLGGDLVGSSNFGLVLVNDTVNCFDPALDLQCGILSGNGNAQWIVGGVPSGNLLNLTVVDSSGMNAFGTNTYLFETTNNDNGCVESFDVTIQFDLDQPFVNSYSGPSSLNCSALDLEIIHPQTGGNVEEGWLDNFGNQTSSDTLLLTSVGDYYYQVQSLENGCVSTDTTTIIQTSELLLDLVSDTTICPDQVVLLTVSPINNSESTAYTWSNGATSQSTNATGGIDGILTVIAQNTSGCIGYDTIEVLITAPVLAGFISSNGCTGGAIQVSNVTGGAGNYLYSLDQNNWQNDAVFTDLSFGIHTIYIQDDLNCIYAFDESIDGNSVTYDINFLVSTYNQEGDTLAIVNISNFTGFDSLEWILPNTASVYSLDDSMVVLSIPLGGWYDITLVGYQDTCMYSFTKPVFFGDEAPVFSEDHDALGIQSTLVFPNPTSGSFEIAIELGVVQNYTVVVTNLAGQPITGMQESGIGKDVSILLNFPFGTTPGAYIIHVVADYDARQETIILN